MGLITRKGRIFVFICLNLYITIISGLPTRLRDGTDSTKEGKQHARDGVVSYQEFVDGIHRRKVFRSESISRVVTGRGNFVAQIQEVKVTHKPNEAGGKPSGYDTTKTNTDNVFHAHLQNGKLKFTHEEDLVISKVRSESAPGEIALAQREPVHGSIDEDRSTGQSSSNMVLTIASVLVGLFSMSVLVAIFQCCCKKKTQDDTAEEKVVKDEKENDTKDDAKAHSASDKDKDSEQVTGEPAKHKQ